MAEYLACVQAHIDKLEPMMNVVGDDFDRVARNNLRTAMKDASTQILTLLLIRDGNCDGYSAQQLIAAEDMMVAVDESTDMLSEILDFMKLRIKPYGDGLEELYFSIAS